LGSLERCCMGIGCERTSLDYLIGDTVRERMRMKAITGGRKRVAVNILLVR
jgi:hypothetical protein